MLLCLLLPLSAFAAKGELDSATVAFLAQKLKPLVRQCKGVSHKPSFRLANPKNATDEYIDPEMITKALREQLGPIFVEESAEAEMRPQISSVTLSKGGETSTAYTLTLSIWRGEKKVCDKAFSKKITWAKP